MFLISYFLTLLFVLSLLIADLLCLFLFCLFVCVVWFFTKCHFFLVLFVVVWCTRVAVVCFLVFSCIHELCNDLLSGCSEKSSTTSVYFGSQCSSIDRSSCKSRHYPNVSCHRGICEEGVHVCVKSSWTTDDS